MASEWYQNQLDKEESKPDPRGKTFYNSFAEYAVDFPEAEELQLSYYKDFGYSLIKLERKSSGINGDYLTAKIIKYFDGTFGLRVQDCDDTSVLLLGEKEYLEKVLNDIKLLAPLNFIHLIEIFGFQYD